MHHRLLFWQSKSDYLSFFQKNTFTKYLLIILNYLIWLFLFFIAFLLIKNQINTFWQILAATLGSEIIERFVKSKVYWKRPMYKHHSTPLGLVKSWYRSGSFPSGHTLKATFFFLFALQYSVISPSLYLLIVIPLLIFRILVGFHYPIDLLGGSLLGVLAWFLTHQLQVSDSLNSIVSFFFKHLFFLN